MQTKKADWQENIFPFLLKQASSRAGEMGLKETKKGPEKARKGRKESLDKVENSEKVPRNKTLNEADICDTYSMAEWQNVIRWQNGRMAECH